MLAGEPIPVARLALTGDAGPSATMVVARQEGAMRYLILTKTANGLEMRPTEEGVAEALALIADERGGDEALLHMLEPELGNGWSTIPPEAIGALTSAPIISEDSVLTDDGGLDFHWDTQGGPQVYAHMNYMVEDPVEKWARSEAVYWVRALVEKRPAVLPPIGESVGTDAGQQAFVVVLKRLKGDTPKIEKISDGAIHLTREAADTAHAALPEGMERDAYEVREVLVEFTKAEGQSPETGA